MPKLFYIARDSTGRKITGSEDAANQEELIGRLQANNLVVVNILTETKDFQEKGGEVRTRRVKRQHGGLHQGDLVLLCRQLATLLGAGVTILKSLDIILKQLPSRKLANVIKNMMKDMEAGLSLHEAMGKHPKIFSDLWVNLVESGEASGNLAVVLNRLAGYLERNAEFKKRIVSALIYPMILGFAGFGALFFLTVKIIPTFATMFKGFNIKLPFLTLILVGISDFLRKYILVILGVIITVFFLLKTYLQTKNGRRALENLLFKLPVFGDFFHALLVERFSSEMSTLVESGVPILYSLEISEHSVDNLIMADIIRKIKEDVREGKLLSQQLERSNFFEPMVVQMVAVGEEIGELSQMFKRINEFYQDYVTTFLDRFASMFEPIMLIFMGGIIGIMVVGMFLPIFQIAKVGG